MTAEDKKKEILDIPVADILADTSFNCRGTDLRPLDVVDLANDIEARGLIQPVIVTLMPEEMKEKFPNHKYRLIAGFRRHMAHRVKNIQLIQAIVRYDLISEADAMSFNLAENLQRQDLDILQEARSIQRLQNLGMSRPALEKALRKSWGWIQVRFYLLELPAEVQLAAKNGLISQTDIRTLKTFKDAHGSDYVIRKMAEIRDARERGVQKPKIKQVQTKETRRIRGKVELQDLQTYIRNIVGNGIETRILAWAMGHITTGDFLGWLKAYCEENGYMYMEPEFVEADSKVEAEA